MILNAPINTRTSVWRRVFLHCKKKIVEVVSHKLLPVKFRFSSVILLTNFFFLSQTSASLQSQTKLTVDLHFSLLFWRIASVNKEEKEKSWVNELLTILLYNLIFTFEQVSRK